MTDILEQLKIERRWTSLFLVLALSLVGAIQGWEYTQVHATAPVESSSEVVK